MQKNRSANIRYNHVFCTKDKSLCFFTSPPATPSPLHVENPAEGGGEGNRGKVKFVKLSDDLNSDDEAFTQKLLTLSCFLFP